MYVTMCVAYYIAIILFVSKRPESIKDPHIQGKQAIYNLDYNYLKL